MVDEDDDYDEIDEDSWNKKNKDVSKIFKLKNTKPATKKGSMTKDQRYRIHTGTGICSKWVRKFEWTRDEAYDLITGFTIKGRKDKLEESLDNVLKHLVWLIGEQKIFLYHADKKENFENQPLLKEFEDNCIFQLKPVALTKFIKIFNYELKNARGGKKHHLEKFRDITLKHKQDLEKVLDGLDPLKNLET